MPDPNFRAPSLKIVRVQVVIAIEPDGSWHALGEKGLDLDWHVRSLSDGVKPGTVFHRSFIELPIPSTPRPTTKFAASLTWEGTEP